MKPEELDVLIQNCAKEEEGRTGIRSLRHDELERVRVVGNVSASDFLDEFARRVAHEYHDGRLSFEVADASMNALNAYVLHQYDVTLPSYAEDVYDAFDAGEYQHGGDDFAVDPEEKYTRPMIASLVIRDRILR